VPLAEMIDEFNRQDDGAEFVDRHSERVRCVGPRNGNARRKGGRWLL